MPRPMYGVVVIYPQVYTASLTCNKVCEYLEDKELCSLYPHVEEILSGAGILTKFVANVNVTNSAYQNGEWRGACVHKGV